MDADYRTIQFVLIDKGQVATDLDDAITEVTRRLVAHVKEHGPDAKRAKAEVSLKLTFAVENTDDGFYTTKAEIKTKAPSSPARVTTAVSQVERGKLVLAVKASGSDAGDPRQRDLKFAEPAAVAEPAHDEASKDRVSGTRPKTL